ncbi:NAD(P)-dependent oxidoreductase [Amycolatopsis sp. lyj-90]|uniref:NAD(P)-dependent oxidoreductase n=1 Tax=Amycolatopsis sp. lyj-90 TaxID=2789285 RepID=UPI00397E8FAD
MRDKAIAVLGLGGMGSGIAKAIRAAGFEVTVFNRSVEKARSLEGIGVRIATSIEEAVAEVDVVVLSLADEAAVNQVLFEQPDSPIRPGSTVIDTSTVSPAFSHDITEKLASGGVSRVEACVVGNPHMAAEGKLRVFAAGAESDVDSVRDVLDAFGQEVRYLGAAGSGSALKLAFNSLLGVQTAALAEAVSFVEAMGMSRDLLLNALDNSGWRSPVLSFRLQFMLRREYRPAGFRSELMHKDLALVGMEAKARGATMPLVECAAREFEAVLRAGRGDDDAAVVVEVRPSPTGDA